jgi:Flp pilus assembly protein TadB
MNRHTNPFHARAAFARTPQSPLGKLLTVVLGAILLALAVMFSLVALAVLVVGGTLFAGWLWWKTRALRRAMREAVPPAAADGGAARIIEGEFSRETGDGDSRRLD